MKTYYIGLYFFIITLLAIACGGGGAESITGGGIEGTGTVPTVSSVGAGEVTQFGSVYVDGVRYDTTSANIEIDGEVSTEALLKAGMQVIVLSDLDASAETGVASNIIYRSELLGLASNIQQDLLQLTVGDNLVQVSDYTNLVDLDFDDLNEGDILAVSGFYNENSVLEASFIDRRDSLGDLAPLPFYDIDTDKYLFVRGIILQQPSGNTFVLKGRTHSFTSETQWIEGDQTNLAIGSRVFVKSQQGASDLIVQSVRFLPDPNLVLRAEIESLSNGGNTITLLGVEGSILPITTYRDRSTLEKRTFQPLDLSVGESVVVTGFRDSSSNLNLTSVTRLPIDNVRNIQGEVTGIGSDNIVIMGIDTEPGLLVRYLDENGTVIDKSSFSSNLSIGDLVRAIGLRDSGSIRINSYRKLED